jgi:hypothetical protein
LSKAIRAPTLRLRVLLAVVAACYAVGLPPANGASSTKPSLYERLLALRYGPPFHLPAGLSQASELTPVRLAARGSNLGLVGAVGLGAVGAHGLPDAAIDIAIFKNASDALADPWFVNDITKGTGAVHLTREVNGLPPPVRIQIGKMRSSLGPPARFVRIGFIYDSAVVVGVALDSGGKTTGALTEEAARLDRYGLQLLKKLEAR